MDGIGFRDDGHCEVNIFGNEIKGVIHEKNSI